jgi:ribosomal protein S1
MHVSETPLARGEKPAAHYAEGDPVRVRVLRIEPAEQRIGLSSRDVEQPVREEPPAEGVEGAEPAETGAAEAAVAEKVVPAGTDPHE